MTTQAQWKQLAEDRLLDARALLAPGVDRWSAAFYLTGYTVECGLKACVVGRVGAHPEVIYQERRFLNDAWTHDIEALLALADLKAQRDKDAAAQTALYLNWQQLKNWSEKARYEQKTQVQAQQLYDAVTDPSHGVMPWIRAHW